MVILTGDTHGSFDRIEDFCVEYDTTTEDTMIILGDAGINCRACGTGRWPGRLFWAMQGSITGWTNVTSN